MKIKNDSNFSYNDFDIYSKRYEDIYNNKNDKILKEQVLNFQNQENEDVLNYLNINNIYECSNDPLYISLDNLEAKVQCENKFLLQINYNEFSNYQFNILNNSVVIHKESIENETLNTNIEKIIKSLILNQRKDIIFSNFTDPSVVASYIQMFSTNDIELWIDIHVDDIINYTDINDTDINDTDINDTDINYTIEKECIWHNESFSELEYWENAFSNTNWRKTCINDKGMLHYYNNDEKLTIVYIPKKTLIYIICAIICLFFFIMISTCIIGSCRYKHKLKVYNLSE